MKQEKLILCAGEPAPPVSLTRAEMLAKLAEHGIAAASPLGAHALSGGRFWTRDGFAYQIGASPKSSDGTATARSDGASRQCPVCWTDIEVGSAVVLNQYNVEQHEHCAATCHASKASAPALGKGAGKTLVDICADIYCGVDSDEVVVEPKQQAHESKSLLDRAADAWCGPRHR